MRIMKCAVHLSFAALLTLAAEPSTAWSQGRFAPNRGLIQNQPDVVLMFAPREVQVMIDEARTNIESQQWSEATLALGMLLGLEDSRQDDTAGVDFFLADGALPDKKASPKDSIFQKVFELIDSLPLEATKFIDLRYGVRAGQILEKALSDSDWEGIEKVAGRYSFTTSGQDACVILGEHWLRKGDARRAARFFSMAFRQKSALSRLGPELGLLTAAAYDAAGMQAEAFGFIEQTRDKFPNASLNWSGARVGWEGRALRSKDILERIGLGGARSNHKIVKQPFFLGGDSKRNADTNAGIPIPILRWHTELHESKQHKENLEKTFKDKLTDNSSTLITSRVPIQVGQWVITSTYDQRIVAIDMQTGRLGWECFYSGMPLGSSMDAFLTRDSHVLNLAAPDYLARRVWGDSAVGMPTSDGRRVYSISELPALDIAESFAQGPNARVAKPQGPRTYNVMQCWSIPEEGKIQWEVGGQKSPNEPKLAGALFLGAPLPHGNELLVLGEINSDLYLFALKPETGKLLWRQPMATNYSSIATDQFRRSVGAVPAADGSIIVCPTLSGYLVGFDTVTRSLLWSFRYNTKIVPGTQLHVTPFGQAEAGDFSPFLNRSADNSVTLQNGVAVFAPADGDAVYAISIDNGSLLWQTDPRNGKTRYVAGAWNDIVIIANQTSFEALDLKTGKEKWPAIELPNDEQVIGRGVRKGGFYFLPTSGQTILQIDVAQGKVVDSVKVERPLGNLVSLGDRLVCASPFELGCYAVREAFQSQLKEELQKNSVSRTGLTKQGELALVEGDYEAALKFLEQANQMEPNNAEVLILMSKVAIAALSADFDKYIDRVTIAPALFFEGEGISYLKLLAGGFQKQGRYKDSLLKLLELADRRTAQRQDQIAGGDFSVQSPQWTVQEDRWISTQIRRCMEKLTPEEHRDIARVMDEKVAAISSLPSNVRRLTLEHLESIPAAGRLRAGSASDLIRHKDLLQAERLLLSDGFLDSADPASAEAIERKTKLAEIYARSNRFELALKCLNGNEALFKDLVTGVLELPLNAREQIANVLKNKIPMSAGDWPAGRVVATTSQMAMPTLSNPAILESSSLCRWKSRIGESLLGWSVYFGQGNFTFASKQNETEFRSYIDVGKQDAAIPPVVHSVDSIVMLEMNRELIAINTLNGAGREQHVPLWREPFAVVTNEVERGRGRASSPPNNAWGMPLLKSPFRVVSVSRLGVVVLHEANLVCLDLTSGKRLWTATGFKDCQFASQDHILSVFRPKERMTQIIDVRDGSLVTERPIEAEMIWVGAVGKYWLLESAATKNQLSMLDPTDGRILFTKQFSSDTQLAVDGEIGLIALQGSGSLTYWNGPREKEFVTSVPVEGNIKSLSAHRFGETILVMPYIASLQFDSFGYTPSLRDSGFSILAGRLIAISALDGQQVWSQNNLVQRPFSFPIAQERNSPVAVFVRKLTIPKIAGITDMDLYSFAAIDLRDGHVVFAQDDLPAVRERGFVQRINHDEHSISIDYLGTNITLNWMNKDPLEKNEETVIRDFGNLDEREFRIQVEENLKRRARESFPNDAEKINNK
jgi:outer membrane protein assembly factor BamB/tetratricopeptide (TPR) repeat protein